MIVQYKYKFFLNAMHFVVIEGKQGAAHSHCFEIVVDIAAVDESKFTMFKDIEMKMEELLEPYQDKLLNDISPFDEINPTIENIGKYLSKTFNRELYKLGWAMLCIEISESPSRSFIINVVDDEIRKELTKANS